jgi:hypothetical protein
MSLHPNPPNPLYMLRKNAHRFAENFNAAEHTTITIQFSTSTLMLLPCRLPNNAIPPLY